LAERLAALQKMVRAQELGPSYMLNIHDQLHTLGECSFIELQPGHTPWWNTRLYLVAALAQEMGGVQGIVFVDDQGQFVKASAPGEIRPRLGQRWPALDARMPPSGMKRPRYSRWSRSCGAIRYTSPRHRVSRKGWHGTSCRFGTLPTNWAWRRMPRSWMSKARTSASCSARSWAGAAPMCPVASRAASGAGGSRQVGGAGGARGARRGMTRVQPCGNSTSESWALGLRRRRASARRRYSPPAASKRYDRRYRRGVLRGTGPTQVRDVRICGVGGRDAGHTAFRAPWRSSRKTGNYEGHSGQDQSSARSSAWARHCATTTVASS
jgi:hypothetical protein